MKKRIFFVILVYLSDMSLFGQQELWTTSKTFESLSTTHVISMSQVKAEILKFANRYNYYTDSYEQFDTILGGEGWASKLELLLNDNKGFVNATQAPIYGEQMVVVNFIYGQGVNILFFHNGGITDRMPTSNRRRLEQIIDQLIAECR